MPSYCTPTALPSPHHGNVYMPRDVYLQPWPCSLPQRCALLANGERGAQKRQAWACDAGEMKRHQALATS